jgi:prolyl-tRNA editing enzyme YbaK/EbsC (Cys-tRNA(Pro) deacylase)
VIKTLVMEDEKGEPLDRADARRSQGLDQGARAPGGHEAHRAVQAEVATRHSGYLIGAPSPFGTRKRMPIYLERSVLALPAHLHQRRRAATCWHGSRELARALAHPC